MQKIAFYLTVILLLSACSDDPNEGEIDIFESTPNSERGLVITKENSDSLKLSSSQKIKVSLNTNPGKDVTITPSLNVTNGGATISPSSIVLGSDWNEGKEFEISGVCDSVVSNSTFTLNFSNSNDLVGSPYPNTIVRTEGYFNDNDSTNFEKDNSTTISGEIIEDPYVLVVDNETSTTESGGAANIYLKLCSQPTSTVTLSASKSQFGAVDQTDEGSISPVSYSITTAGGDWDSFKVFTVTGIDDNLVDLNQKFNIDFTTTGYSATVESVTITNHDNETPQIVVSTSALVGNVDEAGTLTQNFTVKLSQQPVEDIKIGLAVNNDEATLSDSIVTFTSANYNIAHSVSVSGVDDSIQDFDQNFVITVYTISGTGYSQASPAYITGTNLDND